MPLGGVGTQAGAPWRASIARTGAEGGDTLPRADVGPGGGGPGLCMLGGSGAVQRGSLMVSVEYDKHLLHATCRTDWRLEKLELERKPGAKSGKPGYSEGLHHTRGSGKRGFLTEMRVFNLLGW